MSVKKEDSIALVNSILTGMNAEMLAVQMDRSMTTIFKWKKGICAPGKGDFLLLKRISETQQKGSY